MAAVHNRPKDNVDFCTSMKPVTPGWLSFPLTAHRLASRSVAPPTPNITPCKAKFLSTHHKRVFPLNFAVPTSPLDCYRASGLNEKLESFPEPSSEPPKAVKIRARRGERPQSLAFTLQGDFSLQPKTDASKRMELPRLATSFLPGSKTRSRSIDYEDYVIGGNSYNSHLAERLYHPRIIRVSSRSKFRLYSLTEASPRHVSTACSSKPSPVKTTKLSTQQNITQRTGNCQLDFDGVTYELPALSFADKMSRIKYIVDNTLPDS